MYGRGDVDYANERIKKAQQLQLTNMDSAPLAGPFLPPEARTDIKFGAHIDRNSIQRCLPQHKRALDSAMLLPEILVFIDFTPEQHNSKAWMSGVAATLTIVAGYYGELAGNGHLTPHWICGAFFPWLLPLICAGFDGRFR